MAILNVKEPKITRYKYVGIDTPSYLNWNILEDWEVDCILPDLFRPCRKCGIKYQKHICEELERIKNNLQEANK